MKTPTSKPQGVSKVQSTVIGCGRKRGQVLGGYASVAICIAGVLVHGAAVAQQAPDPALERRRQEERTQALQRQLQDKRAEAAPSASATANASELQRLPKNEAPCFDIREIQLLAPFDSDAFDGEASLSAERGWLLRNELSTGLGDSGHEVYFGLDCGEVTGHSSPTLLGNTLAGAVVGLRGSVKRLQYELFVGAPVSKPTGFATADVATGISLNYNF